MRRILIILVSVLACAGLLAGALLLFVDVDQFRAPIQSKLQQSLHRNVTLGPLSLKLIPLAIQINDVAIGEAPEFGTTTPFLAAKQMYVRVGLTGLLQRRIEVDSLRVLQPSVELIRNHAGQWNFQTLSGAQTGSAGSSSSTGESLTIGELLIEDGTVAVTDQAAAKSRSQYDHINIALRNFAPGKHFDLDTQVHLPGTGKEQIALKASGSGAAELEGTLSLEAVSLTGLRTFLGAGNSELTDVVLSGDTKFQSQKDVLSGKGSITISDAKIKEPGHFDFEFRNDSQSGVVDLPSFTAKLGGLALTGRVQTKTKPAPTSVDAEINTDNAPIAEFLKFAKMAGVAGGVDGSGTVTLHVHVQGSTAAPSYAGTGSIRNASFSLPSVQKPVELQTADLQFAQDQVKLQNLSAGIGSTHLHGSAAVKNFAHPEVQFAADVDTINVVEAQTWTAPSSGKPGKSATASKPINGSGTVSIGKIAYNDLILTDVKADCKLDGGLIRLSPLTAKLFGGTEAGDITVDTRAAQPKYEVQTKLANIDVNKLLSATTSVRNIFSGTMSGNADLHLAPVAGQEMPRGLNGNLQFLVSNGKLSGISVLNEAAKVGKFLGYTLSKDNVTTISKMSGTLKIQDGSANTNDLQMDFDGGSLTGAGTIGLADQTLNLKVTTVLAKDTSQKAGGSQIGGFMSTALANSKGELVVPAIVKGTFAKPQVEPDAGQIAKMKLGGLLPTKDAPGAAISKLSGLIGGSTTDPAKAPAGKVVDLLNSLGKKKK